jgi:hypothetical protein
MNEQHHVMVLEKALASGEEDWYCPTCGRRFIVKWEPKFRKKVIEIGDENAAHSGSKGSLQMGLTQGKPPEIHLLDEEPAISMEHPTLAPWIAWLDEVDFENLWNNEA